MIAHEIIHGGRTLDDDDGLILRSATLDSENLSRRITDLIAEHATRASPILGGGSAVESRYPVIIVFAVQVNPATRYTRRSCQLRAHSHLAVKHRTVREGDSGSRPGRYENINTRWTLLIREWPFRWVRRRRYVISQRFVVTIARARARPSLAPLRPRGGGGGTQWSFSLAISGPRKARELSRARVINQFRVSHINIIIIIAASPFIR